MSDPPKVLVVGLDHEMPIHLEAIERNGEASLHVRRMDGVAVPVRIYNNRTGERIKIFVRRPHD